jgi:hypothetical protein
VRRQSEAATALWIGKVRVHNALDSKTSKALSPLRSASALQIMMRALP